MDTATRISILAALISIPNITDNDVVDMDLSFNAVWASKTGTSSFNGKADLKTNVGAGIGIAQISSSASGGGAIARKSAFSSFNTYIAKDHPLGNPTDITIAKIKSVLHSLIRQNTPINS